jgi:hypothetical protein
MHYAKKKDVNQNKGEVLMKAAQCLIQQKSLVDF